MLHSFTMLKLDIEENLLHKSDLQNHSSLSFNFLSSDALLFSLDLQKRFWPLSWVCKICSDLYALSEVKWEIAKPKAVFTRNLNKLNLDPLSLICWNLLSLFDQNSLLLFKILRIFSSSIL